MQPKCKVCDEPAKLVKGEYKDSCGTRRCSAILMRQRLKADPEKFAAFVGKVKANVKNEWASRSDSELKTIRAKIGATSSANKQAMTKAERRAKFTGNPEGYAQSLEKFWKTASPERKAEVVDKRVQAWGKHSFNDPKVTEKYLIEIDDFLDRHPNWITNALQR